MARSGRVELCDQTGAPVELLQAVTAARGQGSAPSAAARATGASHALHASTQALRILVVEDNPVNQVLAARLLQKRGHSVELAGNGCEALAAFARGPFDLLLMDVQMPEMDGLEATAAIRKSEMGTGRHVPIIAVTAHAMTDDRDRCFRAGMDAYLTKPLAVGALFDTIAAVMSTEKAATEPAWPRLRSCRTE